MARPKVALISRRKALEAALTIMDTEGLDALSIRRLAAELGVNGASLYHHFANKEEIIVGATEIALADARTPPEPGGKWRAWLPRNNTMLRTALLEHPELVPVIVRRSELGMGTQLMESTAQRLVDDGVPVGAVAPLLDALEMVAIGSAVLDSRTGTRPAVSRNSVLAQAHKARVLSDDELFEVVNTAIVGAVMAAAKKSEGARQKRAPARRASASRMPAAKKAAAKAPAKKAAVKTARRKRTAP